MRKYILENGVYVEYEEKVEHIRHDIWKPDASDARDLFIVNLEHRINELEKMLEHPNQSKEE